MGRIVAAVAALAVAALVAAGVWLYLSLDHVVKRAIEKYVPEILQASVELDEVKLSLADGVGAVKGMRIGNPKGFRAPHAATAGTIELALDPAPGGKDGASGSPAAPPPTPRPSPRSRAREAATSTSCSATSSATSVRRAQAAR